MIPSLASRFQPFAEICSRFPKGDRAPELNFMQEKQLEDIYNEWRGKKYSIAGCDDCLEETLERLYEEYSKKL
jgi:hypothetical protein